jgi:hypothetical protein
MAAFTINVGRDVIDRDVLTYTMFLILTQTRATATLLQQQLWAVGKAMTAIVFYLI